MRHALGRSALLLSGGAIMGMYHIGVVQTLMEADCMPKIIAGSSAGSIIASVIATRHKSTFFDGKSLNFQAFANQKRLSLFRQLKRTGKEGYVMDIKILERFLRDNIG
jgi:predicted acylesterase/phospholipase RssA